MLATLLFDKMMLRRLHPEQIDAGLIICSLPVPPGAPRALAIGGRPTFCQAIGQWPQAQEPAPRRLLLVADGANDASAALRLTESGKQPAAAPPTAALERYAQCGEPEYFWERHLLRIVWNGVSVGLTLGLRTGNEVRWAEACGLVIRAESPECRTLEFGGAIPLQLTTAKLLRQYSGYKLPLLHRHNWLNGHIYARLHANGVCEIYAHHINSKFDDDGLPLEDAVPVVGIRVESATAAERRCADGVWDGSRASLKLGGVQFDLAEAARLATPERPGQIDERDGFLVWQPYQAMELYGGLCPKNRTGDPMIFHAEQKIVPRGMARTLRFSFSLNPARSPRVARYLPPAWWYGHCAEFSPAPLLPVSNAYDVTLEACRQWVATGIRQGGFEDGSIPRHEVENEPRGEPGWEGEMPYGQFLIAWRKGDAGDYDRALRAAYHFTDVAVDHAACLARMHGYPPNAFAVPMQRVHACVAAYLETGDPYLFNTARAVIDNAYWTHKNSWPRLAVGRDACFIRGAVLLYRYFADAHYREMARDSAGDVVNSQRADGSFGDQGGGAGVHGWGAYITKPWMGLMAVGGLLDYLDTVGDDTALLGCVKQFADWLMRERYDHDGVMGWGYQHYFNNTRRHFCFYTGEWSELPGPGLWHKDYLARLLLFCSLRFNDPRFFDAWAESYQANPLKRQSDHAIAQSYQFLTWLQDRLWNARLTDGGIVAEPVWLGARTPREGTIATPDGACRAAWTEDRRVQCADGALRFNPQSC